MSITVSKDTAEAMLRAAAKAGYKELAEELLGLGVKASSQQGVALLLAEYYGHTEIAGLLRTAIRQEHQAAGPNIVPFPS